MGVPAVSVDFPAQPVTLGIGLYGAAVMRPSDRGVAGGIELPMPRLGGHGLWEQTCTAAEDNPAKSGGDTPAMVLFPGTGVWAYDDCPPVGLGADAVKAAEDTLKRTEQHDVELFTASVLNQRKITGTTVGAAITSFTAEGLVAVVHIAPSMMEQMVRDKSIYLAGGRYVHALGAAVVVGSGYEGELTTPVVTGPIVIYRSPVETVGAFSTRTNGRAVLAERTAAVAWLGPAIETEGATNG